MKVFKMFPEINQNLVNFFQILTAIATTSGVLVSLRISSKAERVKLKTNIYFQSFVTVGSGNNDEELYIAISVVNCGLMHVTVTNLTLCLYGEYLQSFSLQPKGISKNTYIVLPEKINYGEELVFMQKVYSEKSPWAYIKKFGLFSNRCCVRVNTTIGKNFKKTFSVSTQNSLVEFISEKQVT